MVDESMLTMGEFATAWGIAIACSVIMYCALRGFLNDEE